MPRKSTFFLAGILIASLTFTGCGKKEKPAAFIKTKEKITKVTEAPRPSGQPITEEKVLFSFEEGLYGWEIPEWALEKENHVAKEISISKDFASEGKASLKIECDFPGKEWTAAVVEVEQFLDFSPYREIAVDIYIPKDTPLGLRAKVILTIGDEWKFTEMNRSVPLVPGEWTIIRANIEPGSLDWKSIAPDKSFRSDVRKIVVRIESNKSPVYKGPVYIDNLRIGK